MASQDGAKKVVLFANTDWYLYNFRLPLAQRLREEGYEVILVAPPGPFAQKIKDAGFLFVDFPFSRRGMNPFMEWVTIKRFEFLLRQINPHAVHLFTIKCVLYGAIAARMAGVKHILCAITGLGSFFSAQTLKYRLLRPVIGTLYKTALRGNPVIFQNSDDQATLQSLGYVKPEQCHLIKGSGVDVARFNPSKRQKDPKAPFTLLFASRLIREKGPQYVVQAVEALQQAGRQLRLEIAGEVDEGNPHSFSQAEVDAWQAVPGVELIGHQDDMEQVMAQVDAVILPTKYGEGVPRILIEAAAMGLANITTDHPGCREIVQHEQTGLLVPYENAEAIAQAVARLMDNPAEVAAFGEKARALVEAEFSEAQVLDRTLALYTSLKEGGAS